MTPEIGRWSNLDTANSWCRWCPHDRFAGRTCQAGGKHARQSL